MSDVKTTAVVGTGVIGASWAALFLARGHDVVAYDPGHGAEEALRSSVDDALPVLATLDEGTERPKGSLRFASTVEEAVEGADFVQESGPERLDVKKGLLSAIDAAAPAHAVVASSSSGLLPSLLQKMGERRPERILVGHPFNPAHLIPLVEVVPGELSSEDAVASAMAFYASLGKRPILVRAELPGHVANRLQAALWQEAYSLVERGVASVADVDAAITQGPGLRWALLGPLTNMHLSGGAGGMAWVLEHLGPSAQAWMDDLRRTQLTPHLVDKLVAGVDDELQRIDQRRMVEQRDELLIALIKGKGAAPDLP